MLKVSDLEEQGILPEEFFSVIPFNCPTCYQPTLISDTLTSLECSNIRCPDKIVQRVLSMFESLGIKGWGESIISKIVVPGPVTNPLEIMSLRIGDGLDGVSQKQADPVLEQIEKHATKGMLLWEYVALAQLPGIQTSAEKIFSGYENLDDFYDDLTGVDFVQDQLGVQGDEFGVSIQSINAYETLKYFEEDLKEGTDWVKIETLGDDVVELKVVISDAVRGYTKKEFENFIAETFPQYHVTFGSSVNQSIDALIWEGADGSPARYTSKVRTVEGYNDRGINVPILTSREFVEVLKDGNV